MTVVVGTGIFWVVRRRRAEDLTATSTSVPTA